MGREGPVAASLLIDRGVLRSHHWNSIGLCVESQSTFRDSLDFPASLDVGVRIARLNEKSIRFELAIFADGAERAAVTGYFVHVYVNPDSRRPIPLTDRQRKAVADLQVG